MTETMLADVADGVGWLTINNPERRNAVSVDMALRGAEIMTEFAADPAVRAIAICGAGDKAWMSGADLGDFDAKQRDSAEQKPRRSGLAFYKAVYDCRKPVIAAIHGYCLGGGVALACACDLRIAATDAVFAIPAGRLGIAYPPDFTRWMVETIGVPNSKEILFTAKRYSATDALRIGLVNQVVDLTEFDVFARDYARTIAANAPLSLLASKLVVREVAAHPAGWDEALCRDLVEACRNSQDFAEGRRAFAEKRNPVFRGA
jgi:enoyl-CoA hydratase/carnithine racemase